MDTKFLETLREERQKWYEYAKEVVENDNVEWEDVFLEYDYSPTFNDEFLYADFEYYKGGFIALDNLLIKLQNEKQEYPFLLFEDLYGKSVMINGCVKIWDKDLTIENSGRWIPKEI